VILRQASLIESNKNKSLLKATPKKKE